MNASFERSAVFPVDPPLGQRRRVNEKLRAERDLFLVGAGPGEIAALHEFQQRADDAGAAASRDALETRETEVLGAGDLILLVLVILRIVVHWFITPVLAVIRAIWTARVVGGLPAVAAAGEFELGVDLVFLRWAGYYAMAHTSVLYPSRGR